MRIFVTGAKGFIGAAIVEELIGAGHRVVGLARSDAGVASLAGAGADVHRGSLVDRESLRIGAAGADGVIHAAFIHHFANYAVAAETDRCAVATLGDALAGSDRPMTVTSGILLLRLQGPLATEDDAANPNFPRKSEAAVLEIARVAGTPPALSAWGRRSRLCPASHRHRKGSAGARYHAVADEGVPFQDIASSVGA
jgi:NAD(P)-dependent dehydrogenase (short-subunit alcohol dehydrogenase family)